MSCELVECIQCINLVWLYELWYRTAIITFTYYRFIQSDDLNEDFEGALLNLYENLVRGV